MVTVGQGSIKVGDPCLVEVDHARLLRHSAEPFGHTFRGMEPPRGGPRRAEGLARCTRRLRFDFSHPKPMSPDELERVEDIANDQVLQNRAVTTRLMVVDDAIASGACSAKNMATRFASLRWGMAATPMGWSVEWCGQLHRATDWRHWVIFSSRRGRCARCAPDRSPDGKAAARLLINSFK